MGFYKIFVCFQIVADAGVIPGSDMTTEAALTKLAYVLSKDEWDFTKKTIVNILNFKLAFIVKDYKG